MKTLYNKAVIIAILYISCNPFVSFGQFENFILEDQTVIYQKIFEQDSLTQDQIQEKLYRFIPTVRGLSEYTINKSLIIAKIANNYIDCSKYLPKKEKASIFLNFRHEGQVLIDWKTGRYRLVVKDLTFYLAQYSGISLTVYLTKTNKKEFRDLRAIKNACTCLDSYFTELFTLKTHKQW